VSSVEMADAQGELLVADQEWQRVKSLGKEVVSGSRYTEAQVNRQRAMAKVLAYGMSSSQANRLLTSADATQATGEFDVLAPLSGTVLAEDFLVGELIEPGHVLFELSDESTLWVEARISANSIGAISEETAVRISANRKEWREAKVVQIHHRLDEVTRTQGVRIQVDNTDDWLHAGQFVEVELLLGSSANALTVPVESIVLLKGDTIVFRLEEGNEFHPESVTLGATHGEDREVLEGLKEGDVFAESGAFFLKSLLLKSELGEGHGH
jgi:cobalt-zinc-cadmium efflux system membrane fusion protein